MVYPSVPSPNKAMFMNHYYSILSSLSSIATAAILLLAGCAKEPGRAEAGSITVKANVGAMTKVQYSTDGKSTSFTAGDKIAVYGWTGGADAVPATRVVDGVVNTLGTDGKWSPESPMLWKNVKDEHYFLGVFPVRTITDFTADPYTLDPTDYEESDLLIATNVTGLKAQDNPVALTFDHALAKLVVNLKFRSQWETEPTVTSVSAMAKKTATVDYLAKALTATGTAEAVALTATSNVAWSSLQVPQEGVRKVTLTIDNKEYVYESATDIPLKAGQYTTLDLMVGRDKIELGSLSVTDWAAGTVLPDGEAELVDSFSAARYLTFTSEGTTKISLSNYGGNAPKMYYSYDKTNWTEWDYSELTFTSSAPLYLCGDNPDGFSFSDQKWSRFTEGEGDNYSVSGDIMSLIDRDTQCKVIPSDYCFRSLFSNCDNLTQAPELPATTLAKRCYYGMFNGCTSLKTAPELPAKTLAEHCYDYMFHGCTSLTTTPELLATTLAENCYSSMFWGCTSLTAAPELPATTLTKSCYSGMFTDCTGLTAAPELPATTLANYCYNSMFYGCTGLTAAPDLPATTLAEYCYLNMFHGCTSLTAAPKLPATTLAANCYANMFYNCTGLTAAPDLPATILAERCYNCMFYHCENLNYVKCLATDISAAYCVDSWLNKVATSGTFIKAEGMNDWPSGASGIPDGWTVALSTINGHEYVDLGLPSGLKWATCNVGATKPEEYGDHFAWGETVQKTDAYSWSTHKYCINGGLFSKYVPSDKAEYWDGAGSPDNKTVLDAEDDAATANWGAPWRTPTDAEWTELIDNCTSVWTTQNGVNGLLFTSKNNGSTIFLPAAGRRYSVCFDLVGSLGYYWSSSLKTDNPSYAWNVYFDSSEVYREGLHRFSGYSVRPVTE